MFWLDALSSVWTLFTRDNVNAEVYGKNNLQEFAGNNIPKTFIKSLFNSIQSCNVSISRHNVTFVVQYRWNLQCSVL